MSRRAFQQHALVTSAIIEGRFASSNYPGTAVFATNCRQLARAYNHSRGRPKLQPAVRLFDAVERYTRILHQLRDERYKVVPYLVDLAGRCETWQRAPEDFRPRTTHGRDQLLELVEYLFEAYRAPSWLRAARRPRRGRPVQALAFGWYVHVARGQSLRSAPRLPLQLTRRAAHEALRAPSWLSPQQALLYGYLRSHDAPKAVRDELLLLARAHHFTLDEAQLKLWERIARSRQLPVDQVRPLLHYAEVRRAEGGDLDEPIPVLLRGMERWHAALRAAAVQQRAMQYGLQFDERWASKLSVQPLRGSDEHGDYTLSELRSLRELFEEGQRMSHCVFTYGNAARAGTVSIWTLCISRAGRELSRVTLRIVPSERCVVEARRRCNQVIQPHERELLRGWASSQGLSLAPGV